MASKTWPMKQESLVYCYFAMFHPCHRTAAEVLRSLRYSSVHLETPSNVARETRRESLNPFSNGMSVWGVRLCGVNPLCQRGCRLVAYHLLASSVAPWSMHVRQQLLLLMFIAAFLWTATCLLVHSVEGSNWRIGVSFCPMHQPNTYFALHDFYGLSKTRQDHGVYLSKCQ